MDPEVEQRLRSLELRLKQAEERVAILSRLRVDDASGGGQLVVSSNDAVLRVNALTDVGQQLP